MLKGTFRELAASLKRATRPKPSTEGFFSVSHQDKVNKEWKAFNECIEPKVTRLSEKDEARIAEEVRLAEARKGLSVY
jgi:hypothetical protein